MQWQVSSGSVMLIGQTEGPVFGVGQVRLAQRVLLPQASNRGDDKVAVPPRNVEYVVPQSSALHRNAEESDTRFRLCSSMTASVSSNLISGDQPSSR